MKQIVLVCMLLASFVAAGQVKVVSDNTEGATRAAAELRRFLAMNGNDRHLAGTIHVGDTPLLRARYAPQVARLKDDGFLICGSCLRVESPGAGDDPMERDMASTLPR